MENNKLFYVVAVLLIISLSFTAGFATSEYTAMQDRLEEQARLEKIENRAP
jgi:hypothetical protein